MKHHKEKLKKLDFINYYFTRLKATESRDRLSIAFECII